MIFPIFFRSLDSFQLLHSTAESCTASQCHDIDDLYLQDQEGAGGQGEEESKACRDETKDMRLRNMIFPQDSIKRGSQSCH